MHNGASVCIDVREERKSIHKKFRIFAKNRVISSDFWVFLSFWRFSLCRCFSPSPHPAHIKHGLYRIFFNNRILHKWYENCTRPSMRDPKEDISPTAETRILQKIKQTQYNWYAVIARTSYLYRVCIQLLLWFYRMLIIKIYWLQNILTNHIMNHQHSRILSYCHPFHRDDSYRRNIL